MPARRHGGLGPQRLRRSLLAAVAVLTMALVLGPGAASDATVVRSISRDDVEHLSRKLNKAVKRYGKYVQQPGASDWPSYLAGLDRQMQQLRKALDRWESALDDYIPDHFGEPGISLASRYQVALRNWVADEEAVLDAMHGCVDPLPRPVDAEIARTCVDAFVAEHSAEFAEHVQALQDLYRDAKRSGLVE